MRPTISVIVTRYNEDLRTIEKLCEQVYDQIGVEGKIELLVVDDNPAAPLHRKSFYRVSPFGVPMTYLLMEKNGGPGLARQFGLDNALGEYVLFIDGDDRILSLDTISKMLELCDEKAKYIITSFLEERKDDNGFSYALIEDGVTWVHGKLYNRQFAIDNNIRFSPTLRLGEDTYWSGLWISLSDDTRVADVTTIIWSANPKSITRQANFWERSPIVTIEAQIELVKALFKYDGMPLIRENILRTFLFGYFCENDYKIKVYKKADEIIDNIENQCAWLYRHYGHLYEQLDYLQFVKFYNQVREAKCRRSAVFEEETFRSFMERIKQKAEETK